jgi:Spy/CpxP family protein refolding chaperone
LGTIVFQNDDKYMAERESNMKRNWVLLTIALVVLALTASQVMAQPPAAPAGPGGPGGQGGPGQGGFGRGGMRGMGQDMYDQVGLTDEQKKKMEDMRADFTKQLESATPETRRDVFTKMRTDMENILTPEQKTKMEELRAQRGGGRGFGGPGGDNAGPGGPNRGSMFPFQPLLDRIKLTDDQKAQVTKLQREAIEKLFNDIRDKVLTPEQREELKKLRAEQPAPQPAPGAPKPPAADKVAPAPAKDAAKPAPADKPADKPARGTRRAPQQ